MSLESASFIHQLNPANPSGADRLKEGDDHIRMVKQTLKNTFPGITGPLDPSVTHEFLNSLAGLLVPRGSILAFAGETVPPGWWLCDGSTATLSDGSGTFVTPDMRGRTLVGADATHPLGALFGQYAKTVTSAVAGAHSHTVDIPAHHHDAGTLGVTIATATTGATFHYALKSDTASGGTGKTVIAPPDPSAGGIPPGITDPGHTHGATVSGHTADTTISATAAGAPDHAHSVTIDTAQPSIAVNYIIKV